MTRAVFSNMSAQTKAVFEELLVLLGNKPGGGSVAKNSIWTKMAKTVVDPAVSKPTCFVFVTKGNEEMDSRIVGAEDNATLSY